jgi:hypothetical protein
MTDFFHRLAGRTLGTAPVVRPVIAPMFAPGPALPNDLVRNPLEDDGQEVSPEEMTTEMRRTPRLQRAILSPAPPSPMPVPRDTVVTPLHDRRPASTILRPSSQEDISPEAVRARRTAPGQAPIMLDEPSTTAPFGQNKSDLRPVTNESPVLTDTVWEPLVPSSAAQSTSLSRLSGEPRNGNPSDRRTPLVVKPLMSQAPEPAVRFAERRSDRLENMTPSSPPTIRVTIGRVDVRAIMPPPTPVRQAKPTTPKVSLDEYLRVRRGGQR